jgi:hypothetical protein
MKYGFKDNLSDMLNEYLAKHGLPKMCAQELLESTYPLTANQREWLEAFCAAWDAE